jgi:hypothetical protein
MFIVCVDSTVSDDCASLGILTRRNLSIEPGDEVHIRVCERIPTVCVSHATTSSSNISRLHGALSIPLSTRNRWQVACFETS